MIYNVKIRKGLDWGVFAIFPKDGCWDGEIGKLNLSTELGRFKARSQRHAVKLAQKRGIGEPGVIWAIEVLDDSRVKVAEMTPLS
jgi:hypothetical protein